MAWDDQELTTRINELYVYHKYWKSKGVVSPRANKITKQIMDFKDGPDCVNYKNAVKLFSKRLLAALTLVKDEQLPRIGVIVPRSTQGEVLKGLCELMADVESYIRQRGFKFDVIYNCLERHTTVPSNAKGGSRHMKKHFESIRVNDKHLFKNHRVLVIDDVSTTGNTIRACKRMLQDSGAGDVIMVVVGQTCLEKDDDV